MLPFDTCISKLIVLSCLSPQGYWNPPVLTVSYWSVCAQHLPWWHSVNLAE
jgi:hypothetical protein